MNFVTINEKAAAMALDFVVGPEVRMGIERLYELLATATQQAYDEGFEDALESPAVDSEKHMSWSEGYDIGYEHAKTEGEDDESEGFYAVEDEETAYEALGTDECQCEQCTVERAEASEQDDTLPPMQEQGRSPFAWSPGVPKALWEREARFND